MSSFEYDNFQMTQSGLQERQEELPSDSSHKGCLNQDCFYQDDTHSPCYMCNNHGIDSKSTISDDGCAGVEFAIRSFWRIAKTQNDIESPMEGNSKGFHYRLLLHPRGTAGTDSESSHLSVFVEAVVQDWYPEYWVFPNVRFELTVVNFKDPKQSVTSWAHWSFSSDATSRGWQKMISHSRLTKAAGFMDDEGTVLIRGKAEPPYPCLWSKSPIYQPQMMWEYIPDRAQREICSEVCNKMATHGVHNQNRTNLNTEDENISDYMLLKCLDSVVPAISPTLDSDFLSLMVHVLYHLREFRRSVLMWNYEFDSEVTEETSIILSLQKVFAYMYLYPLAVSCRTYKISAVDNPKISKYYLYELVPKSTHKYKSQYFSQNNKDNCSDSTDDDESDDFQVVNDKYDMPEVNCCSFDGGRFEWEVNQSAPTSGTTPSGAELKQDPNEGYRLVPGSLSHSIGERPDVFSKMLPPAPNLKPILKAMHMTDLQTLEPQDQLVNLHSEMFTMILRDLASAKKLLKQRRIKSSNESTNNAEVADGNNEDMTIPVYLRDQTLLESTCKFLFSGSPENETLFSHPSVDDISTIYIRCKHSNSLQKALESTPKTLARYPQVLFFYLYPTKNAKKGELFDVPLRLDCTSIKSSTAFDNMSDDSRNTNNYDEYGVLDCSDDEDDGFAEFDNVCDKEHTSVKWYSLYALIIKEGDMRYDAVGKGTNFNTLLLRPEEDGPWYRMSEGKVEKLNTKMEFTEWKCHRDFFCVSAVYIAEDYIDMLQVGEVDLLGNLKQWNPNLYYSTLSQLGVTEQDLLAAVEYRMNQGKASNTNSFESQQDLYSNPDLSDFNREAVDDYSRNAIAKYPELNVGDLTYNANEMGPEYALAKSECVYDYLHLRRIGRSHPRLSSCCEVHGYNPAVLTSLDEKERRFKYEVSVTKREVIRRVNRLKTIAPFVSWLFNASKENTALLNAINPPADGKLLVNFLQKRERIFEEEFRHLISEVFFKEIAENVATNSVYSWTGSSCSCGCNCKACLNRPALFLTENGRFPGEDLKLYLSEPATILFRNIQILRCHLEYFCKDCRNLTMQLQVNRNSSEMAPSNKDLEVQPIKHLLEGSQLQLQYPQMLSNLHHNLDMSYNSANLQYGSNSLSHQTSDDLLSHKLVKYEIDSHPTLQQILNPPKFELGAKGSEINEFRSTSERSSLFLVECIWDACVRYTMDCRTILFLKACSDENLNKSMNLSTPLKNSLVTPTSQSRNLFVLGGGMGHTSELLDQEETNHFDAKFDLTVQQELDIMKHYTDEYNLPTVSEMRNYLRRKHVLVYPLIRPHELLRSYMAHRYNVNVPEQLERMGYKIVWNEEAFNQKASLSDLSEAELKMYGINSTIPDSYHGIGTHLCNIYEKLLTKMLVHMQDVNKQVYPNCFDYVYTVGDIAKIVEAIKMECDKTLSVINSLNADPKLMDTSTELYDSNSDANDSRSTYKNMFSANNMDSMETDKVMSMEKEIKCGNSCGNVGKNMHLCTHEGCVCLGHECRFNFGYSGYILPFWVSNEMADLTVFTNSQLQAYNESLIEDLSELCLKTDDKKKKKVKTGKQGLEKATCIIPPLDVKLKTISFDQYLAYQNDPNVFLSPSSLSRFYYKRDNMLGKHKFNQIMSSSNPHSHDLNISLSYLPLLNLNSANNAAALTNSEASNDNLGALESPEAQLSKPSMVVNCKVEPNENECFKVKNSLEIGILTTHDLFGLEGFSCETKILPTKRLFVNHKYNGAPTKVAHLYWAIRKLLNSQISDEFLSLGSSSSKSKKKTKCICGQDCPDENECTVKLSWRPCAGDCFMLYALKNDLHSLRLGKKFVYMQPAMDLSYYVNTDKNRVPDITLLICGGPSSFYLNGSNTWFPLPDDTDYPLLIFKWMCVDSVDLLCLGAIVCDAKKQLQQYIFEWLLPIIRELGYLSSVDGSGKELDGDVTTRDTSKDEDVDRYQVLEECYIRSVQNVRRWSCAIKKINKRSGDVIITQLKRTIDSPATIRFKESVLFMNSVKELTELEALELLPDSNNFYSDTWSNPQQDEPDLGNKLSKKKKRKSAKSAIPSNKKSTFSRRVHPAQDDEEEVSHQNQHQNDESVQDLQEQQVENDETDELLEKMTERNEDELYSLNEDDSMDKDELYSLHDECLGKENMDDFMVLENAALLDAGKFDKQHQISDLSDFENNFENFERNFEKEFENEFGADSLDEENLPQLNLMDKQALLEPEQPDSMPTSPLLNERLVSTEKMERSEHAKMTGDINTLVKESEFRMVLDLCPTLGLNKVCDEVYMLFENEFKNDFVQKNKLEYIQLSSHQQLKLGRNLKNLLKLVKMMYTRVSGPEPVRQMVKKLYENYSLKASYTLSYLLQYYNSTIQLMDDILAYVLKDIIKFSHFLFGYRNEYIKMLLEHMVSMVYKNDKLKDKLDSSVMFLLNTAASPKIYSSVYSSKMQQLSTYQKLQVGFTSPKKNLEVMNSEDSVKHDELLDSNNDLDSANELIDTDQLSASKLSKFKQNIMNNYDLENDYNMDNYKRVPNSYDKELDKKYELEKMIGHRTVREMLLYEVDDTELVSSPFLQWLELENEQFEKLYLQQLKTWWSNRHTLMDKIKSTIHPSNHSDSIQINVLGSNTKESREKVKDELTLDIFELRILLQFAESCSDVSLCFNKDSITLYFYGKIDKRQFVKSIKEARRFFGSNNTVRSIPNLPVEHTDTTVTNASLMDMQLNNNQTSLLLLSIKYSSFTQQVDSQFLKSVCTYKTHKLFNIPPPPRNSASLLDTL